MGITGFRYSLLGLRPETTDVPVRGTSSFRVNLALARTSEIVVVTATRTPVSEQDSGASVSTLESRRVAGDAAGSGG